jgi:hypothetical protein
MNTQNFLQNQEKNIRSTLTVLQTKIFARVY